MQTSAFSLLGVAAACLLSFSAIGADEASAVAKPDVKVGERWSYRRTDYLTNKVSFSIEGRVVSMGPDEILLVAKRSDQSGEFDVFFTSEWGVIVLGGTTFIPRTDFFKFPLKVGATHQTTYETANKGSPARAKFELAVKVMGWEDIEVPAGKFRALKLEANGNYIRLEAGNRSGGMVRVRYWYVPEIKRWAKYTYEEGSRGLSYPDNAFSDELIKFSVQ
jgi:hypothetical protein